MSKATALSIFFISFFVSFSLSIGVLLAQSENSRANQKKQNPTPTATFTPRPTVTAKPKVSPTSTATLAVSPEPETTLTDISQGPLEKLISDQVLGSNILNPIKYAIHGAVKAGVPANTIVLLLLLPLVAAVIAATRHLIGIRGFGIFLPASLSVVFVATGPVVGLGLFILITLISIIVRFVLKKLHLRLQYLPRMAFLLWAVSFAVLGVLFAAPLINYKDITSVSIFPVLLLALLAEDFTRVQLGKSFRTALSLTSETLVLSLVSYLVLTFQPIQRFALINPEILLIGVAVFDLVIGKYVGLRLREIIRFRKLISS